MLHLSTRIVFVSQALLLAAPALAQTALPDLDDMAARSGSVLGAAAGCGVPAGRIAAVRLTVFGLLRHVAFDAGEAKRAEQRHRKVEAEAAAGMQGRQGDCPAAVAAFERAEAN